MLQVDSLFLAVLCFSLGFCFEAQKKLMKTWLETLRALSASWLTLFSFSAPF
jgi:hypothetical protein